MTRRSSLAIFLAMLTIVAIGMIAGTKNAAAQQNPNCCTYTVEVSAAIPQNCLPIKLYTKWNCNPGIISKTYSTAGIHNETIGAPLPPCPQACLIMGISLDGVNFFGPNMSKNFTIGNCCYALTYNFGAGGCINIKIGTC